jgi:ribose transport system ATP-binding protein
MVEIAKALSINARVLIMDEPTSSLSQRETENLFQVINDLRVSGVSIIYISHRLSEVKELADRVTVLRDGKTRR